MSSPVATLLVGRDQFHLAWDRSIEPVATVPSGSVVEFDALDSSGGQITAGSTAADTANLDFSRVDGVHGPVAVEGAEVGDTLEIELLEFVPADWGWTATIPGFGLLADDFPEPALRISHLAEGTAEFLPGIRIPLAPFCGEVGVAPHDEGAFSTIPPTVHGGNMDTKHITAGTRLFLPVGAPGGRLSVGDGHAAQGDGEVCGTAIETLMRATVRLTVRKELHVSAPEFLIPGPLAGETNIGPFYATDGVGPELRTAAKDATRRMIDYLGREHGIAPGDAYMLCSVACDLKISEVVDEPNWIVTAYCPLSIFG